MKEVSMFTVHESLEHFHPDYPIEKLAPPENILFLDIETTGFTARSSYLYLIGCAYYKENSWHIIQWFAEDYTQEYDILVAFFEFAKDYHFLIHFNGNNFDLPFLLQKCTQYHLSYDFSDKDGLDIYRRISPYKYFLKLNNCKQKTIEQFLGIRREDVFSGGELIGIYHDFVKEPTEFSQKALLLHNADDIQGMMRSLSILTYHDLLSHPVKAKKVQANSYLDLSGKKHRELLISLALEQPLPRPVSYSANNCYFKGEDLNATIRVPVIQEEMKYFYSNYKDYYYLPDEDVALHKSVAAFVDREHRTQATAATCYTRKYSEYLPQWDALITPLFLRDYHSKEYFFELTDELKKDRDAFSRYARHLLDMMIATY